MRRGGVLILLIGLILIVGAVALFLFLQPTGGGLPGVGGVATGQALPTEIPEVEVVRARVDIPANTVITDSLTLLEVISIPQSEFDADENFSTIGEVEGKLTIRPFRANEILSRSALIDPGLSQQIPTAEADRAADKAYPFVVNNITGVADQVKPGDFVDIVATFEVTRPVSTVTENQEAVAEDGTTAQANTNVVADQILRSTKTIVQRAQVIRIVRPPVATEPTPEGVEGEAAPAVDDTGQPIQPAGSTTGGTGVTPGTWTLVLAINDQEAELMEFAVAAQARVVLVLRGAGDTAFEPTIGVTLDLLIDQFGLPLPQPLQPYVFGVEQQLTPQPTRTPAPTRVP